MDNQKKGDLKISGSGSSGGGCFDNVKISGQGRVKGDVECDDFSVSGLGTIDGKLHSTTGRISGSGTINGDLSAVEFRISGHAGISGNVTVEELRLDGSVSINGSVAAETFDLRGSVSITGDCNAEVFQARGTFSVEGLLNAGNIDIHLYGPCKAKEIGGEKINVNRGHSFGHFMIRDVVKSVFPTLDIYDGLIADVIEGDDIYLEYTRAKVVRGNHITIGRDCKIDLVEYTDSLEVSEQASVTENRKMR